MRLTISLAAMTAALLFCIPADATRIRALDLDAMVAQAQVVVRGRVLSQGPTWDVQRQRVYTDSVVLVDEVLKGAVPTLAVEVRQLGGTLGNIRQEVAGTGQLRLGQTVLLFLNTDGRLYYVVGMAQGRYVVEHHGGVERVTRDLGGAVLVGRPGAPPPSEYRDMADRIRAVVQAR